MVVEETDEVEKSTTIRRFYQDYDGQRLRTEHHGSVDGSHVKIHWFEVRKLIELVPAW